MVALWNQNVLKRVPPPLAIGNDLVKTLSERFWTEMALPEQSIRQRVLILRIRAVRARRVVAVHAKVNIRDFTLGVVQPRAPQVHVRQEARLGAQEVIRHDALLVNANIDAGPGQIRRLQPRRSLRWPSDRSG